VNIGNSNCGLVRVDRDKTTVFLVAPDKLADVSVHNCASVEERELVIAYYRRMGLNCERSGLRAIIKRGEK
jgi:hypothetical protein